MTIEQRFEGRFLAPVIVLARVDGYLSLDLTLRNTRQDY